MGMDGSKNARTDCIQLAVSYTGLTPDDELLSWIETGVIHGLVLFADNCMSLTALADAIQQLRSACPHRLRIMIDEEGGRIRRLPHENSPMAEVASYGDRGDLSGALHGYRATAELLTKLNIDTLLAPVVDVRTGKNEWEADRTFSSESPAVSEFSRRAVLTIQEHGVDACAKHFPGLGGVSLDLHHHPDTVEETRETLIERDCAPFAAAIDAGVATVMVSHAVYAGFDGHNPALLSRHIITNILRGHLGFTGVVGTDDLAMKAVSRMGPIELVLERAARAGCDLALVCKDRELQRRAVEYISK